MKDETPVKGYRELAEGNHGTPHVDPGTRKKK